MLLIDQLFIKLGATPTRVTIVKRSFRILFYFLFFAQLWGPIGNSHDACANHGCRGVGRSENLGGGASNNVVGIICPLFGIELNDLQNLGNHYPACPPGSYGPKVMYIEIDV